jgi:hypothetical protein
MPVATPFRFRHALLAVSLLTTTSPAIAQAVREIVVTNDLVLPKDTEISARLVVRASGVSIDGNGATLVGPGKVGDTNSLENAGVGVLVEARPG